MAMLLLVAALGAGCSELSTRMDRGASTDTAASEAPARPILVTQEWGVVDGMLSVVVRNTTGRTLRSAEGVITARDRNDVLIATSLEGVDAACCAVVDLPPGQEFGFYVDVGDAADQISRVDVAYRNVAWTPADAEPEHRLSALPVSVQDNARGTVVTADIRNDAPLVAQASVQAFLTGPDGAFLAVVAGRWYCFSHGSHQIRMQLLHPVPAGTKVDRIVVHPVPDDSSGGTSC